MIKYFTLLFIILIEVSCSTFDNPVPVVFPGQDLENTSEERATLQRSPVPEILPVNPPERAIPVIWKDGVPEKNTFFYVHVPLPGIPAAPQAVPLHAIAAQPVPQRPSKKPPLVTVHTDTPAVINLPEKVITLYYRDKIVLSLAGTGWIFMGSDPSEGIVFEDKITSGNNDIFYFTAQKYGDFKLVFEKQRISAAKNEKQKILLHLKEKKDTAALSLPAVSKPKIDTVLKPLDDLVKTGEYQKALQSYNKHEVLMKVLEKGVNSGKISALIFFYNKIVEDSGAAVLFKDDKFLDLSIDAGKILIKKGLIKQGTRLIERCLPFNKDKSGNDALLFILGTVYQNESSIRDEKKAVFYYKKLLDEYPASVYWDTAHKEYMFLKRRYIDVR